MLTVIAITATSGTINNNFHDYSGEDRILKNIINGDYEVLYSGQNQGVLDHQLIRSVNDISKFEVYYRKDNKSPFIYLGWTFSSSIVKERSVVKGINSLPNERLQIRLVIPFSNINLTKINTEFKGSGKYKKAILQHSGFDVNVNTNLGFYIKI